LFCFPLCFFFFVTRFIFCSVRFGSISWEEYEEGGPGFKAAAGDDVADEGQAWLLQPAGLRGTLSYVSAAVWAPRWNDRSALPWPVVPLLADLSGKAANT
jgi:hypothetical protein